MSTKPTAEASLFIGEEDTKPTILEQKWADSKPKALAMVAPETTTQAMIRLLERAMQPDVDIEKMRAILAMKKEFDAEEARKAYVAAMADFKKVAPVIRKNKNVSFASKREGVGKTDYWHATLDEVADQVIPKLSQFGFSHDWEVEQPEGGQIIVTCVMTHSQGHSRRFPFRGPKDDSGNKNEIQMRSSAVSYMQRYTLLMACGLAAKGVDNDGRGVVTEEPAGGKLEDLAERLEFMENCRTVPELDKVFRKAHEDAAELRDIDAVFALDRARIARCESKEGFNLAFAWIYEAAKKFRNEALMAMLATERNKKLQELSR